MAPHPIQPLKQQFECNELKFRRIGEDGRAEYGRTLISRTCQKHSDLLGTATIMTGSKKSIKERIILIAKKPKMAFYTLVAVLLIAAAAVYCTFTGAKVNAKPWIDNAMDITVEVDDSIPEAVAADAKQYVWLQIES